ncbi:hypothetical protein K439DRAFT_798421 [Ramaria rubella]|nr:hypothetical protein K439DRAFT_798421 [Ramaria rubella]
MEGMAPWDTNKDELSSKIKKLTSNYVAKLAEISSKTFTMFAEQTPTHSYPLIDSPIFDTLTDYIEVPGYFHWSDRIREVENQVSPSSIIYLSADQTVLKHANNTNDVWLADSGALCHISGNKNFFTDIMTIPSVFIESASGNTFTTNLAGTIKLLLITVDKNSHLPPIVITLNNALYVPKLHTNLLSIG